VVGVIISTADKRVDTLAISNHLTVNGARTYIYIYGHRLRDDDGPVSRAENELINCHLSRT